MRERGIHNVKIRHTENQFMHTDPRQPVRFADQPIVRRPFQLCQIVEIARAACQTRQYAGIARQVASGDETMGVVLVKRGDPGKHYWPPRRASSNCRTCIIAGCPPRSMKVSGVSPLNIEFVFGNWTHTSASFAL